MRLFEHPDFDQAVLRATEHFQSRGLRPAIIEKDYYVTEALRIIAATAGDKVIFKGGTSLAKGWNLIQRFSEDIDLFLDPLAFNPSLGKKAIDRELKKHHVSGWIPNRSKSISIDKFTEFPASSPVARISCPKSRTAWTTSSRPWLRPKACRGLAAEAKGLLRAERFRSFFDRASFWSSRS